MFKDQMTKCIFPLIKQNMSLLEKSEKFCQQLKQKNTAYKLSYGSKWADFFFKYGQRTIPLQK